MASFNVYLKDKNSENTTSIILVVRWSGNTLKYASGKSVSPAHWNTEKQNVKPVKAVEDHKVINGHLGRVREAGQKAFNDLELELNREPTLKELKARIDSELGKVKESEPVEVVTFLGVFKQFIQDSKDGNRLTSTGKRFDKRSIQKYNTVFDMLEIFGKGYNLTFETINKEFYTKFVAYLNKKKFSLNNVGKYIQVIKTFLNYATENGYNQNMYFQSKAFKAHKVAGFSIYLTEKEVSDIYEQDLSSMPHLERVRDLFIVGCWTGLRFSDFTNIKPENIQDNFLHITTFKTDEKVIIPIHWMVRQIMDKYAGKYSNSLPPAIVNQKMNSYLKDIAGKVDSLKVDIETEGIKGGLKVHGILKKWELVTTHTARRSFATNVYKSGFPAISLMKITGHKTEKAFLLYIKVTPEENAIKLAEHWAKPIMKVSQINKTCQEY
ncbi:MAG: site-specific integrase [Algoriphagus sp.]|uniref:site-specific integrase n=1 Tax=Algoriphagus sp. TaxID=1872435 RepID=UPI0026193CDB|nr:site-specific integrase [Algoriphagus sp.]MDG1276561.1 site-specific integrase [Algoriphagus sp.]